MKTNPEGEIVLSDTEKETILQGMRLLSIYCENLTGCAACPFKSEDGCELKSWLPCAWTIPDKWEKEGDK